MWLALPAKTSANPSFPESSAEEPPVIEVSEPSDANLWIGFGLITIGGLFLLRNFGFNWFNWVFFRIIWPILLITAGIYILIRKGKK